jgi:hypothetical protein
MMSLSTLTISFVSASAEYWIRPSPFLSSNCSRPVVSQLLEPLRTLFVGEVLTRLGFDGLHQIQARHTGHRGCGRVQDGNEHQGPARGGARVAHLRHGEEADDHVRQTRRADHQRHGVGKHVQARQAHVGRVLLEAEVRDHLVEAIQQVHVGADERTAETELRQRVAGQLQR